MTAEVRVEAVSKTFGMHQVLDECSVTLAAGGITCLMGPSGAGKTTLLRLIMGLETPDSGRIVGVRPGEVSVMFQEDRLSEALSPVENVALVYPDRRVSRAALRRDLAELLPERSLDQPSVELSGGMRRRVALACALAYPGRLIVLDEPFTGLDGATKREVIRYIEDRRRGRTLLVATHGEEDVELLRARRLVIPALGLSEAA